MTFPRMDTVGGCYGFFSHPDEERPLSFLGDALLIREFILTGVVDDICPWMNPKEQVEWTKDEVTMLIRHIRMFGNRWPARDEVEGG